MSVGRLVLAAAAAALACPSAILGAVEVTGMDASSYPRIQLTVVTSAPSNAPPRVAEHGGSPAGFRAQNLGAAPTVVLALDRSASMAGRPLDSALAAARLFVERKRAQDRIALVAFGSGVVQLTHASADPADHLAALAELTWDRQPGTALYEALRLSAVVLEREPGGGRVVVLLTDGRNRAGGASLAEAIAVARRAGAVVYPVGVRGIGLSPEPWAAIARATGGRYRSAAGRGFASVYGEIGAELRRTWRVEWLTGARPGDRLRLSVWAPGLGSTLYEADIPGAAPGDPDEPASPFGGTVADLILATVVAALVLAAVRAFAAWRRARWLRRRLEVPADGPKESEQRTSLRERLRTSLAGVLAATERVGGGLRPWQTLERMLEGARIPVRTVELLYTMVGSAFGLALLLALFGPPPIVIVAGLAVGFSAPLLLVWRRAAKRRRAFEEQLPDVLMTLASALKAGQSFRQGIQTIVDEGAEPTATEFRLVLGEARLGRPLEQALSEMADRLGSKDFSFVVSTVTIQQQVGGSLAGIFDLVADAVRQRQQFARRIKALTATGRMSAYVLVALPIGLALAMTAMSPAFMAPLYTTSFGRTMIAGGLMMIAIGSLLLRRIVAFKG